MTHERIPLQDDSQRNFYQYLETHPLHINLEPSLQSISSPQSKKLSENNEASLRLFGTESRRQGLDNTLRKLSEKDIPGKRISTSTCDTLSPSELCLPREIHGSESGAYFTGVHPARPVEPGTLWVFNWNFYPPFFWRDGGFHWGALPYPCNFFL